MIEPIRQFVGDHRFLSNFDFSTVLLDGEEYSTVEHGYHAAKTLDLELRKKIQACLTPGEAKKLGRQLKLRPDWERVKLRVMADLLVQKFSKEPHRTLLARTAGRTLYEGNWWKDHFWGTSLQGVGENHLGRMIMAIRDGQPPLSVVSAPPQQESFF